MLLFVCICNVMLVASVAAAKKKETFAQEEEPYVIMKNKMHQVNPTTSHWSYRGVYISAFSVHVVCVSMKNKNASNKPNDLTLELPKGLNISI